MQKNSKRLDIAVLLSLLSLCIALFSLFWNVRPARIKPVMNAVYASAQSGMHLSIPLSIVNTGARPETVVGAKLIESAGNARVVWSAVLAADVSHGLSAVTGDINASSAMLWMPFIVPGNGEVQEVVIFEPYRGRHLPLVASGRTITYRVVLLLANKSEATTTAQVTWPRDTDRILAEKKGGIGFVTTDIYKWASEGASGSTSSP
jgi:hypothetical protein